MANPRENKPVVHTRKHIARLERERRQTRWILIGFIGLCVVAVALIIYGYLDVNYLQARRPVARISSVSLSIGEWQARVRMERRRLINQLQLYQQYSQLFGMDLTSQEQQITSQLSSPSSLGQSLLDQMVDEELIRQEAAKRGITASTQEVDQAIEASYQYYPNGTPTPTITPTAASTPTLSPQTLALVTLTPSPTAVMTPTASPTSTPDFLRSPTPAASTTPTATAGATDTPEPSATPMPTSTPYTLQGFKDSYANGVKQLNALGLTADQVRQLYKTDVLRQKLFDQITADVPRVQEQVWARHILVADEPIANVVRQRLLNGEDFATVAAQVSQDTGTKSKGGDLGWFAKGAMVPEFEAAAFTLSVGEISQPVKSQFGYHIIQVLAHSQIALDAAAYDQAKQTAFKDWLQKARSDYKVATYDVWQNIVPTDPPLPAAPQ